MTDKKISALPAASLPLTGAEILPAVQSSATVNFSVANLQAAPIAAGLANSVSYLNGTKLPSYSIRLTFIEGSTGTLFIGGTENGGNAEVGALKFGSTASSSAYVGYGGQIRSYTAGGIDQCDLRFYTSNGGAGSREVARFDYLGNIVPQLAAKGVNFTANTPAAGMTSQLLNWYEEGTWTPTLTPGTSGSITLNTGFDTAAYTRVGRLVTITGEIIVASVSSPVGTILNLSLPIAIGAGVERSHQVSGAISTGAFGVQTLSRYSGASGASVIEITYAAATVAADFRVQFSISYFA
jgi:hypothetical protein